MKILLDLIPRCPFHVACSGGSDSMVLVDFLRKYPKNRFDLLYFNHGTECCDEAEAFLRRFSDKTGLTLETGRISRERSPGESVEEYWRKERYLFLSGYSERPILMAHHLNDVIETWVMTSMAGKPSIIPYRNAKYNILRPMLLVPKSQIRGWAERHGVEYVEDRSNADTSIRRNYVRHRMMEDIYRISPGIEKILSKKIEASYAVQMASELYARLKT